MPGAGQELDGYRLVSPVGKGAMGEVFLARDLLLERPVAIKFIGAGGASEAARARFMVEARAVARLQHPNVVTIHRVGEHGGQPYIVSEFVEGTALDKLGAPLPSDELREISLGLARGLAVAHQAGVIHRDIKPANAILSRGGQVKLLDFGIAKLLPTEPRGRAGPEGSGAVGAGAGRALPRAETVARGEGLTDAAPAVAAMGAAVTIIQGNGAGSNGAAPAAILAGAAPAEAAVLTSPGALIGTPIYMAPEVWRGESATYRADIYSLGALLYELASGAPPHDAETLSELQQLVTGQDAPDLSAAAPALDPRLAAIIMGCLHRDPAARYASGTELRAALVKLTPAGRRGVLPRGNPYRGLNAFEAEHRDLFFGRDGESRMVLERLGVEPFVLVAGDSGVGKSSLCRAGILPRAGQWGSGRQWEVVRLVPGGHPVTALCVALAPLLDAGEQELARLVEEDPAGIWRQVRACLGHDRGLVIFVDQLEELITLSDPAERDAVAELLGWLAEPCPGLRLLASARGDYLSRLSTLPRVGAAIPAALYFLWPLSRERLCEAIEGPANALGVDFESDMLLDDLVGGAERVEGGLPLLQFTLAELWEGRAEGSREITRADLGRLGGVAGALSRHADGVLAQMSAVEREAARRVLLQLVSSAGTRIRRAAHELGLQGEAGRMALDRLVQGRLVVARDAPGGCSYEITHEALVTAWGTLASWLSRGLERRRSRERLDGAVTEWERLGRSSEALWGAGRLAEAEALKGPDLPPAAAAFLAAGRRAHGRRRWRRVAMLASVPLVAALVYGGVALRGRLVTARKVEQRISRAVAAMTRGEELSRKAGLLRARALARMDAGQVAEGEGLWRAYQDVTVRLERVLAGAAEELETALLLDHGAARSSALLADLLTEQALLAEEAGNAARVARLLGRVRLHDRDGSRMARWAAPGRVTITTRPANTSLTLRRYHDAGDGRLKATPVRIGAGTLELPPGSYLLEARAPYRAPVRLPFQLQRGERLELIVPLPGSDRVPRGFVYIPPGRFLFGSAAPGAQRRDFFHHVPLHPVRTDGYLISRRETTFAQWLVYVNDAPPTERSARLPAVGRGGFQGALLLTRGADDAGWRISFQPTTTRYQAGPGGSIRYRGRKTRAAQRWGQLPVVGITATQARAYAAWLHRTGRVPGARLCSGREWERAARGADGREYPHGHNLAPTEANFDATYGKDPPAMGPDEVGSHPASRSPFGVDDLAGNVWEWTASSLEQGGHVARGGSWYFGANSSRVTDREVTEPSFRDASVGLRVCADLANPDR